MSKPTRAQLLEALETIVSYPLPVFTVERGGTPEPMVPFENADYLKQLAKEALHPEDEDA